MQPRYRIGIDENGLGARLGPLVVTGVLAEVDARGQALCDRALPKSLGRDLGDSKRLVSHKNADLGEAWARVLARACATPAELFDALTSRPKIELQELCPQRTRGQCWTEAGDAFRAPEALMTRLERHVARLEQRGLRLLGVRSEILCTRRLNLERRAGKNRFVADLHAMERLILSLSAPARGAGLLAVCGKVGSMQHYEGFFGPLAGWLHTTLEQSPARSAYRFAGLGELRFVRDADAADPLVMLASLVGKYLRELFMDRIGRAYGHTSSKPSGYHDPRTDRFVVSTAALRRRRRIDASCFERDRDEQPTLRA